VTHGGVVVLIVIVILCAEKARRCCRGWIVSDRDAQFLSKKRRNGHLHAWCPPEHGSVFDYSAPDILAAGKTQKHPSLASPQVAHPVQSFHLVKIALTRQ
jgi:hypothetical protein